MTYKKKERKKLIEVALPLDAINRESAREKSIRHGHPSTLHLWWARRPLAAARAVLWASLVDDPSAHPGRFSTPEAQEAERRRLFGILEELVKWENSNNQEVLDAARAEIGASSGGKPPPVLDPFCGGGTIPLEAQRLGLTAYGGDLNPVAVLISKAMVEIPPRFSGRPPVHPPENGSDPTLKTWERAQGLAEDVRFYGRWMRDRAFERIGHLYPKVPLPAELGGGEATVNASLWARTVRCSNPACASTTPLLTSFVLSKKPGRQRYLRLVTDGGKIRFRVSENPPSKWPDPAKGLKRGMSGAFECIVCGAVTTRDYVAAEGEAGDLGVLPTAIVTAGDRKGRRRYLEAPSEAPSVSPRSDDLEVELPRHPRDVWCHNFGLHTVADLFTDRQLTALMTFSDLLTEVRDIVVEHARTAGLADDGGRLRHGGTGPDAYADAVATYLAFAVDKLADWSSTLCTWISSTEGVGHTFSRHAIPMTWDFVEINPFSDAAANFLNHVEWVAKATAWLPAIAEAEIAQRDAGARVGEAPCPVTSTDPPYYDNIGYADLSDFFYAWLRRGLREVWPDELSTVLTPKKGELIANRYRAGSAEEAKKHFEDGMEKVFSEVAKVQNPAYPATIFYAFKQAESDSTGTVSTGWETFLGALLASGMMITATWPIRTERTARTIALEAAALASSIVIACRPRGGEATVATRSEYVSALMEELRRAVAMLKKQGIAPVDMAQSTIGPGMAVFSRYSEVVEADGSGMSVRQALSLINELVQEILFEEEAEFDADTRWALTWFEQYGIKAGPFGDAETLSTAMNTSVERVTRAGIAVRANGKIRLLGRAELADEWDPTADTRRTVWKVAQHLIARLGRSEALAAELLRQVGDGEGEKARQLAYMLYQVADRRKWSEEAVAYNSLVQAWPEISRLAGGERKPTQQTLEE